MLVCKSGLSKRHSRSLRARPSTAPLPWPRLFMAEQPERGLNTNQIQLSRTSINISAVKANLPSFYFMWPLPAPTVWHPNTCPSLWASPWLTESQVPTSTGLLHNFGSPWKLCFFLEPASTPHSSSVLETQLRHRLLWVFPICLSIQFLSFSYSGSQPSCVLLHSRVIYRAVWLFVYCLLLLKIHGDREKLFWLKNIFLAPNFA